LIPSVVFHEDARSEFDEALSFYVMEGPALGIGFVSAVEHAVARAQSLPESAPLIRGKMRRMRVERFPYSVIYRHVDDAIRVLAVAHDRRRPFYWRARR
jgi:plasmid stabilization system protein ParE